jgi:hypothetical protein
MALSDKVSIELRESDWLEFLRGAPEAAKELFSRASAQQQEFKLGSGSMLSRFKHFGEMLCDRRYRERYRSSVALQTLSKMANKWDRDTKKAQTAFGEARKSSVVLEPGLSPDQAGVRKVVTEQEVMQRARSQRTAGM